MNPFRCVQIPHDTFSSYTIPFTGIWCSLSSNGRAEQGTGRNDIAGRIGLHELAWCCEHILLLLHTGTTKLRLWDHLAPLHLHYDQGTIRQYFRYGNSIFSIPAAWTAGPWCPRDLGQQFTERIRRCRCLRAWSWTSRLIPIWQTAGSTDGTNTHPAHPLSFQSQERVLHLYYRRYTLKI